jgi:8-oxo-dGTP pyrophosphatase MutT (NUDIX family)
MAREISAGGVVLREISGVWHIALIEAQKEAVQNRESTRSRKRRAAVLSLPKGLIDPGEKAEVTAVREVYEETGIRAEVIKKLVDIKYVYVRKWGDGERVFKIVSFDLMRYVSGEIDDVAPEMRIEVKRALWVPLADAPSEMAYTTERKLVKLAREQVETGNSARSIAAPKKNDSGRCHTHT